MSRNGEIVYIACATSGQIAYFNLAKREVLRRIEMPASPSGLALSADDQTLYVTCSAPESTVCAVDISTGRIRSRMRAGHSAMAPILTPDQRTLIVCNRFDNAVAFLDVKTGKEFGSVAVEREPVAAALTPDGQYLFVANHLHAGPADKAVVACAISVVDVGTRRTIKQIPLTNGSTLLRGICVSPDGRFIAVAHSLARFHLPTTHVTLGWMNDNVLTLIEVEGLRLINTVLLDDLEQGAANPWAIAWTPDGRSICVTHAGTHELTVLDAPALLAKLSALPTRLETPVNTEYLATAQTTGDVPNDLRFLVGLRSRIKLPGNGPRALALNDSKAVVACYFSDSLATVDLLATNPATALTPVPLPLHPFSEPCSARKGEIYFNDGTLCYQGWQSCASCHSADARVDGMNWDLQNDGIGNPKNVKSLLLSFDTPPVMSMGVRADAGAAIRAGIRYILFNDFPESYAAVMDDYVRSLKPIPSPHLVRGRLSAAAERGKQIFCDPAVGCATCHKGPLLTDLQAHAVGIGKFDERTDTFYTPTLIEVWRTAPYLHDGSAPALRDAITTHNSGSLRGHTSQLSSSQITDLVAYVESL